MISAYLPYDMAAFQEADAIIACYGCKSSTEIPKDKAEERSVYGPNLPAAVRAAFGVFTPSGSLPVSIPRIDPNDNLTDEILYPAGYGIQDWNREQISDTMDHRFSPDAGSDDSDDKEGNNEKEKSSSFPAGSLLKCELMVVKVLKYLLF